MRPRTWLDAFVIMPDHFHGIVGFGPPERGGGGGCGSLASVVGGFKSACTSRYRKLVTDPRVSLWHRGFYEHWIRGSRQQDRIRRYIIDNPYKWGRR